MTWLLTVVLINLFRSLPLSPLQLCLSRCCHLQIAPSLSLQQKGLVPSKWIGCFKNLAQCGPSCGGSAWWDGPESLQPPLSFFNGPTIAILHDVLPGQGRPALPILRLMARGLCCVAEAGQIWRQFEQSIVVLIADFVNRQSLPESY